ncbi:MAG: TolC family protein [Burkholderiales bacterium]|nr:TolC family protein [Burkholderiales bacterium]
MKTRTIVVLIAAAAAGCALGPDYVRPTVETPDAWRVDYPKAAEVANTKWWEQFSDPVLAGLIDRALRENRDVRVAAARVDQFLGALQSTRSQLYPQIGYGAEASRNRASRVGQPPVPPGGDPYFSLYQASLSAAWQLDLFGRVRRLSEAAQAQVYAGEQARRGVVLSVVASVAATYITLRAFDRQLEIAHATAGNFADTARLFRLRFAAGVVSQTEVAQIESQYQQALASIPAIEQQIAAQENLLPLLLGGEPRADPTRQDDRRARAAADPRRPAFDAPATPARTSCRPSRIWSPRTPASARRARSTTRPSRSPGCSAR